MDEDELRDAEGDALARFLDAALTGLCNRARGRSCRSEIRLRHLRVHSARGGKEGEPRAPLTGGWHGGCSRAACSPSERLCRHPTAEEDGLATRAVSTIYGDGRDDADA
eukprot:scaffold2552_cov380-Prasinococcus_capsulatus_cf.AAC.31